MWKYGITALALLATAQTAPNPNRPTPTFDSVPPQLPRLRRPAVLIFSKTNAFRHDSIPAAVAAIERRVRARGWSSYATENAAVFNPAQLARFDAIVFASASGDLFTLDQRAALERYLASGRGLVGLHAAGDGSHADWFDAIIGIGPYAGHPGGADQFQAGELLVLDRRHPAMGHLPPRWRWTEEYYAWSRPPRADARILARLDETRLRLQDKHRMGEDHALVWWRCEGRARIFYSALGHRAEAWADPTHLALVDGAIGWSARRAGSGCQ